MKCIGLCIEQETTKHSGAELGTGCSKPAEIAWINPSHQIGVPPEIIKVVPTTSDVSPSSNQTSNYTNFNTISDVMNSKVGVIDYEFNRPVKRRGTGCSLCNHGEGSQSYKHP